MCVNEVGDQGEYEALPNLASSDIVAHFNWPSSMFDLKI